MLQQYQTIREIFFRFRAKLRRKKHMSIVVSCKCMDWNTHNVSSDSEAMLWFFGCSKFSVFSLHLTYLQGKHSRSIDRKYNYREC